MTIGDPVLRMLAVCCLGKIYVAKDNLARGRTRISTHSARKVTGKTFLRMVIKQEIK
jgi:hypothetical protein